MSPKTRQRVLNACKKLNFVPNSTARSLSTGKTHLIGLYLPLDDPSLALSQNPFYVEFLAGIESGISQCDYDVVLGSQKVSDSFSSWAKSRNLDAAIMLGRYPNEKIEDIDIADIDVGKNIGAQLQMDQADADKNIAQAKAEERRAMAVALEQEMCAKAQEARARVIEAEAEVPLAMAEAFRSGNLGIMDYYKMKNVMADTEMRESIAKQK